MRAAVDAGMVKLLWTHVKSGQAFVCSQTYGFSTESQSAKNQDLEVVFIYTQSESPLLA